MNIEAYIPDTLSAPPNISETKLSFTHFIFKLKRNRILLLIFCIGTLIQFCIFKLLYPFPDFISDSYSYIETNIYHMRVNLWPIGYSKFIAFVHLINHSDTFLVAIQYGILQISLAYFYFTVTFLYRPAKNTSTILFIFLIFNPLFLYLSNCVLSDSLFASLTILFFVQFLRMLRQPTIVQVLLQGAIIGLAFTIRYAAIYYPLVSLAGLLLSRSTISVKIVGNLLGVLSIVFFILYTKQETKKVTGTAEFSVFGGWQLANNALYMYNYIAVDTNKLPQETRALDRMTKRFFQQVPPSRQELSALPGTYFIKVPWAILKPYMAIRHSFYDDPPAQFRAWGKVSPIYNKYGTYLITNYPVAFAKYYLWVNTKNYFVPHLEKFGTYNLETVTVPAAVQDWFDYITPDIHSVSATFQGKLFYIYPALFMILNIYFSCCLLWLAVTNRLKRLTPCLKQPLLLTSIYLLANFGFSIFATPVVLRYQVVPLIILFTFSMLLLEFTENLKHPTSTKSA